MKKIVDDSYFERQLKALLKKHYNLDSLETVLKLLQNNQPLPGKYKDHALTGNMQGLRECHIADNWLLLYRTTETEVILIATGSHDALFK